jgi:glycine/D-amino acid oxidase-like deaminating enzyme
MGADDQTEYGPTWYSGVTALPAPRTPLNYDLDVDVCVVGGGLAGITVAREVVRRGWSVAVVETRRLAWNASGRNSGFVLPGFSARIEKVVERIGLPAAKALWALSEAGVRYVRDAIAENRMAGVEEGKGWLDVSKHQDADAVLARVSLLGQEIGAEVEGWPIERVRDVLKTSHYFHAIHFPGAFHINPLAYALRLADAAERAGAHFFENTPALAVDPAGVRKRIDTPKGRVRAGRVVLAGNIHLGPVAQRLADTLIPITAYTGVTKPLGNRLAETIRFGGAVSDSRYANYHYRIVGGDRLLWTGGASTRPRNLNWIKRRLERAIRATYPQLGPVAFESFWPAEMCFAVHRMPQIGEVQPGVWLASAFGGQGLNTSAIAGDLIARAMVEGDDTWRLFLPFELVWAGGRVGRTVARATTWWWHQSEAMASLVARRREELQRQRLQEVARSIEAAPRLAYREVEATKDTVPAADTTAAPQAPVAAGEYDRPIGAPEATPKTALEPVGAPPPAAEDASNNP